MARSAVAMIVRPLVFALLLLPSISVQAGVSVARSQTRPRMIDVAIAHAPLSVAVKALELYLLKPVGIESSGDPEVSFSARGVRAEAALAALALSGGVKVVEEQERTILRSAGPLVTLDVKDAEIKVILRSLKEQCGIRNLVVAPGVTGSGTFLLRDVPCRTAFRVVFGMMGLRASYEPNSVVIVSIRR